MEKVYVAIATPNETHLSPFVYGVFHDDEHAHQHFELHGDKNCTLNVQSSYLVKTDKSLGA